MSFVLQNVIINAVSLSAWSAEGALGEGQQQVAHPKFGDSVFAGMRGPGTRRPPQQPGTRPAGRAPRRAAPSAGTRPGGGGSPRPRAPRSARAPPPARTRGPVAPPPGRCLPAQPHLWEGGGGHGLGLGACLQRRNGRQSARSWCRGGRGRGRACVLNAAAVTRTLRMSTRPRLQEVKSRRKYGCRHASNRPE